MERSPLWGQAAAWWETLDQRLAGGPQGIAAWESGVEAALVLAVLAKRMMCWRDLPVPRGVRVLPVAYVEAHDLNDNDAFEEARRPGTLMVGGVGTVGYGVDRTVETLCGLAKMRERAGGLTLWHLAPVGTDRSTQICRALLKTLGSGTYIIGEAP